MADKVEHTIQNQNVCLHLENKHNWPIGNDITTQTKMAVEWTVLLVPVSQCSPIKRRWLWGLELEISSFNLFQ